MIPACFRRSFLLHAFASGIEADLFRRNRDRYVNAMKTKDHNSPLRAMLHENSGEAVRMYGSASVNRKPQMRHAIRSLSMNELHGVFCIGPLHFGISLP